MLNLSISKYSIPAKAATRLPEPWHAVKNPLWRPPANRGKRRLARSLAFAGIIPCLFLGSGCVTPPFAPVALTPLDDIRADDLRREVEASLPERFTVLQSVVFEYRGRSLAAICVTTIDAAERTFAVVAVTPVGMKLFELAGRDGVVASAFVAPGLEARANPVEAIAKDIQRVYLDRIPARDAGVRRLDRKLLFSTEADGGRIEHIMGGTPPVLLQKRMTDARGLVWSVSYHAYEERNGMWHPGGIVFTHRRYRYRLILRLKDVLDAAGAATTGNAFEEL